MILVRPLRKKERKIGSILIPETVREKSKDEYGVIEAVGPSTEAVDMSDFEVGQTIMFMDHPGQIEVQDLKLVKYDDVLGILDPQDIKNLEEKV